MDKTRPWLHSNILVQMSGQTWSETLETYVGTSKKLKSMALWRDKLDWDLEIRSLILGTSDILTLILVQWLHMLSD